MNGETVYKHDNNNIYLQYHGVGLGWVFQDKNNSVYYYALCLNPTCSPWSLGDIGIAPVPSVMWESICTDADTDGYYAASACGTALDCNDNDSSIHPGASESCNEKDDDCDGQIDEGCLSPEPNFDAWVGQWFKGTIQDKGLMVDDLGTDKAVEKVPAYGYVADWDDQTKEYTSLVTHFDDDTGTWSNPATAYIATLVGGTPLDYITYGFVPPGVADGIELVALILHFTGKEKNDVLTKAKGKTVGGCVIYSLGDGPSGAMYFSANEVINFNQVPDDKVPDDVKNIILPPP